MMTSHQSRLSIHFCCLCTRPGILVLVWDALMYNYIVFLRYFAGTVYNNVQQSQTPDTTIAIIFDIAFCMAYFMCFFLGLIADMWTGRYKIVVTGIFLSLFAWILAGFIYIIMEYWPNTIMFFVLLALELLCMIVGYMGFRANIVQFNVDQLVGASANALSSYIYWHTIIIPAAFTVFQIGRCSIDYFLILSFVLTGVTVSLTLISHSLFKHWLETTPVIINPIKMIAKVLNYAWKNKYPKSRSALTYWEKEYPSRIDLGKEKYGGPFSEEEVENVKTVLRLIPLMICVVGLTCADEVYWSIMLDFNTGNSLFKFCFISNNTMKYITSLSLLFLHQLFIHSCFNKYIPSMLKRIGLGLAFAVATTLSLVIIFKYNYDNRNVLLTFDYLMLIPQILYGVAFALIFPVSLEFTIAQSPVQMRGMMVGMLFASIGMGYLININTKFPFGCDNQTICSNFYYYITKTIVILIILIVFIVLAKWYKLRIRENEVNILQIVDEHYERYMHQEKEYQSENEIIVISIID